MFKFSKNPKSEKMPSIEAFFRGRTVMGKNIKLIKLLSILTVFFFSASNVAFPQGTLGTPSVSDMAVTQTVIPEKVVIPQELGSIQEEFHNPDGKSFVVFIQDAHAIVDAQTNIQNLIRYFTEKYGVGLVALEGGKGKLDSTILRAFPDEKIKQKVMEEYLDQGELAGAVMASILNPFEASYFGIEDWPLYEAHYIAYLRAMKNEPAVLEALAGKEKELDGEREKVYSPAHNEFHGKVSAFRAEKLQLLDFLKYLKAQSAVDETKYPHLKALMDSIERDSAIDYEILDREVRDLFDQFRKENGKKLSKEQLREFNGKCQEFATGRGNAAECLKYLVGLSGELGVELELSASMRSLLGHEELLCSIKGTKVFEELEGLIGEEEEKLSASPEEKALAEKYGKILVLRDMAKLELNREKLEKVEADAKGYLALLPDPALMKPHFDFYGYAVARDEALQKNLEALMEKEKKESAIVVLGGFHRSGFEKRLREKGISFCTVTPRINGLAGAENYDSVMEGALSYKEYLKTTFYDAFMRSSGVKLVAGLNEPDFRRVIKVWRDGVIRRLAEEGRIAEAGEYTKYVDLLVKVYVEKFGTENVGKKSKEEIIKVIEGELGRFGAEYLGRMWKGIEKQFEMLGEGLKGLIVRKEFTEENVQALLEEVKKTNPAALQDGKVVVNAIPGMSAADLALLRGAVEGTVDLGEVPEAMPAARTEDYAAALALIARGYEGSAVQTPLAADVAAAARGSEGALKGTEIAPGVEGLPALVSDLRNRGMDQAQATAALENLAGAEGSQELVRSAQQAMETAGYEAEAASATAPVRGVKEMSPEGLQVEAAPMTAGIRGFSDTGASMGESAFPTQLVLIDEGLYSQPVGIHSEATPDTFYAEKGLSWNFMLRKDGENYIVDYVKEGRTTSFPLRITDPSIENPVWIGGKNAGNDFQLDTQPGEKGGWGAWLYPVGIRITADGMVQIYGHPNVNVTAKIAPEEKPVVEKTPEEIAAEAAAKADLETATAALRDRVRAGRAQREAETPAPPMTLADRIKGLLGGKNQAGQSMGTDFITQQARALAPREDRFNGLKYRPSSTELGTVGGVIRELRYKVDGLDETEKARQIAGIMNTLASSLAVLSEMTETEGVEARKKTQEIREKLLTTREKAGNVFFPEGAKRLEDLSRKGMLRELPGRTLLDHGRLDQIRHAESLNEMRFLALLAMAMDYVDKVAQANAADPDEMARMNVFGNNLKDVAISLGIVPATGQSMGQLSEAAQRVLISGLMDSLVNFVGTYTPSVEKTDIAATVVEILDQVDANTQKPEGERNSDYVKIGDVMTDLGLTKADFNIGTPLNEAICDAVVDKFLDGKTLGAAYWDSKIREKEGATGQSLGLFGGLFRGREKEEALPPVQAPASAPAVAPRRERAPEEVFNARREALINLLGNLPMRFVLEECLPSIKSPDDMSALVDDFGRLEGITARQIVSGMEEMIKQMSISDQARVDYPMGKLDEFAGIERAVRAATNMTEKRKVVYTFLAAQAPVSAQSMGTMTDAGGTRIAQDYYLADQLFRALNGQDQDIASLVNLLINAGRAMRKTVEDYNTGRTGNRWVNLGRKYGVVAERKDSKITSEEAGLIAQQVVRQTFPQLDAAQAGNVAARLAAVLQRFSTPQALTGDGTYGVGQSFLREVWVGVLTREFGRKRVETELKQYLATRDLALKPVAAQPAPEALRNMVARLPEELRQAVLEGFDAGRIQQAVIVRNLYLNEAERRAERKNGIMDANVFRAGEGWSPQTEFRFSPWNQSGTISLNAPSFVYAGDDVEKGLGCLLGADRRLLQRGALGGYVADFLAGLPAGSILVIGGFGQTRGAGDILSAVGFQRNPATGFYVKQPSKVSPDRQRQEILNSLDRIGREAVAITRLARETRLNTGMESVPATWTGNGSSQTLSLPLSALPRLVEAGVLTIQAGDVTTVTYSGSVSPQFESRGGELVLTNAAAILPDATGPESLTAAGSLRLTGEAKVYDLDAGVSAQSLGEVTIEDLRAALQDYRRLVADAAVSAQRLESIKATLDYKKRTGAIVSDDEKADLERLGREAAQAPYLRQQAFEKLASVAGKLGIFGVIREDGNLRRAQDELIGKIEALIATQDALREMPAHIVMNLDWLVNRAGSNDFNRQLANLDAGGGNNSCLGFRPIRDLVRTNIPDMGNENEKAKEMAAVLIRLALPAEMSRRESLRTEALSNAVPAVKEALGKMAPGLLSQISDLVNLGGAIPSETQIYGERSRQGGPLEQAWGAIYQIGQKAVSGQIRAGVSITEVATLIREALPEVQAAQAAIQVEATRIATDQAAARKAALNGVVAQVRDGLVRPSQDLGFDLIGQLDFLVNKAGERLFEDQLRGLDSGGGNNSCQAFRLVRGIVVSAVPDASQAEIANVIRAALPEARQILNEVQADQSAARKDALDRTVPQVMDAIKAGGEISSALMRENFGRFGSEGSVIRTLGFLVSDEAMGKEAGRISEFERQLRNLDSGGTSDSCLAFRPVRDLVGRESGLADATNEEVAGVIRQALARMADTGASLGEVQEVWRSKSGDLSSGPLNLEGTMYLELGPIDNGGAIMPVTQEEGSLRVGEGGQAKTLKPGESVTLGRRVSDDIQIAATAVSRNHARVTYQADGTILVDDVGSEGKGSSYGTGIFVDPAWGKVTGTKIAQADEGASLGGESVESMKISIRDALSKLDEALRNYETRNWGKPFVGGHVFGPIDLARDAMEFAAVQRGDLAELYNNIAAGTFESNVDSRINSYLRMVGPRDFQIKEEFLKQVTEGIRRDEKCKAAYEEAMEVIQGLVPAAVRASMAASGASLGRGINPEQEELIEEMTAQLWAQWGEDRSLMFSRMEALVNLLGEKLNPATSVAGKVAAGIGLGPKITADDIREIQGILGPVSGEVLARLDLSTPETVRYFISEMLLSPLNQNLRNGVMFSDFFGFSSMEDRVRLMRESYSIIDYLSRTEEGAREEESIWAENDWMDQAMGVLFLTVRPWEMRIKAGEPGAALLDSLAGLRGSLEDEAYRQAFVSLLERQWRTGLQAARSKMPSWDLSPDESRFYVSEFPRDRGVVLGDFHSTISNGATRTAMRVNLNFDELPRASVIVLPQNFWIDPKNWAWQPLLSRFLNRFPEDSLLMVSGSEGRQPPVGLEMLGFKAYQLGAQTVFRKVDNLDEDTLKQRILALGLANEPSLGMYGVMDWGDVDIVDLYKTIEEARERAEQIAAQSLGDDQMASEAKIKGIASELRRIANSEALAQGEVKDVTRLIENRAQNGYGPNAVSSIKDVIGSFFAGKIYDPDIEGLLESIRHIMVEQVIVEQADGDGLITECRFLDEVVFSQAAGNYPVSKNLAVVVQAMAEMTANLLEASLEGELAPEIVSAAEEKTRKLLGQIKAERAEMLERVASQPIRLASYLVYDNGTQAQKAFDTIIHICAVNAASSSVEEIQGALDYMFQAFMALGMNSPRGGSASDYARYRAGVVLNAMTETERAQFREILTEYLATAQFAESVQAAKAAVAAKKQEDLSRGVASVDILEIDFSSSFDAAQLPTQADRAGQIIAAVDERLTYKEMADKLAGRADNVFMQLSGSSSRSIEDFAKEPVSELARTFLIELNKPEHTAAKNAIEEYLSKPEERLDPEKAARIRGLVREIAQAQWIEREKDSLAGHVLSMFTYELGMNNYGSDNLAEFVGILFPDLVTDPAVLTGKARGIREEWDGEIERLNPGRTEDSLKLEVVRALVQNPEFRRLMTEFVGTYLGSGRRIDSGFDKNPDNMNSLVNVLASPLSGAVRELTEEELKDGRQDLARQICELVKSTLDERIATPPDGGANTGAWGASLGGRPGEENVSDEPIQAGDVFISPDGQIRTLIIRTPDSGGVWYVGLVTENGVSHYSFFMPNEFEDYAKGTLSRAIAPELEKDQQEDILDEAENRGIVVNLLSPEQVNRAVTIMDAVRQKSAAALRQKIEAGTLTAVDLGKIRQFAGGKERADAGRRKDLVANMPEHPYSVLWNSILSDIVDASRDLGDDSRGRTIESLRSFLDIDAAVNGVILSIPQINGASLGAVGVDEARQIAERVFGDMGEAGIALSLDELDRFGKDYFEDMNIIPFGTPAYRFMKILQAVAGETGRGERAVFEVVRGWMAAQEGKGDALLERALNKPQIPQGALLALLLQRGRNIDAASSLGTEAAFDEKAVKGFLGIENLRTDDVMTTPSLQEAAANSLGAEDEAKIGAVVDSAVANWENAAREGFKGTEADWSTHSTALIGAVDALSAEEIFQRLPGLVDEHFEFLDSDSRALLTIGLDVALLFGVREAVTGEGVEGFSAEGFALLESLATANSEQVKALFEGLSADQKAQLGYDSAKDLQPQNYGVASELINLYGADLETSQLLERMVRVGKVSVFMDRGKVPAVLRGITGLNLVVRREGKEITDKDLGAGSALLVGSPADQFNLKKDSGKEGFRVDLALVQASKIANFRALLGLAEFLRLSPELMKMLEQGGAGNLPFLSEGAWNRIAGIVNTLAAAEAAKKFVEAAA